MWPCKRLRRSVSLASQTSELEHDLSLNELRREQLLAALETLETVQNFAGVAILAWPVVCAVAVALLNKLGFGPYLKRYWFIMLPTWLGPVLVCYLAQSYIARRRAAYATTRESLEVERADALERVKTTLPMAQALQLLMVHDPHGDHKQFIECPPHLQRQIDGLAAEREEFRALANELLLTLGTHLEGGWGAAGEALQPLAPVIRRLGPAQLPAAANLLSGTTGVDSWLLSRMVATPAPPHTARRRPGTAATAARWAGHNDEGEAAAVGDAGTADGASNTPRSQRANPVLTDPAVTAPRTATAGTIRGTGGISLRNAIASIFSGGKATQTAARVPPAERAAQPRQLQQADGGALMPDASSAGVSKCLDFAGGSISGGAAVGDDAPVSPSHTKAE